MAVFWVCEFLGLLKGNEYQFWTWIRKPQFWNPRKTECFQLSVNFFLSNCWLYFLVLYKRQQRNLEFWTCFSVIYFCCSAAKEGFQTPLFKTQVLTQPDFQNLKKIHFKPEKVIFWFTLKLSLLFISKVIGF